MTTTPQRFLALVTRSQLTEMLSRTYAEQKNIDPNEANRRLEVALRDLQLIHGLQEATWHSLADKKPNLEPKDLVEHVAGRLAKPRSFQAAKKTRKNEGAWAALTILIDKGAGFSGGEAISLLETTEGQALLRQGFTLAGEHLASEMLR